jgi:hypothetical protein
MKRLTIVAGAALLALGGSSTARGHVIDPSVDPALKTLVKLRSDIGKQVAKYTFCLVKAATNCEKGGASSASECNLATGAVAFESMGGKYTDKFQEAIAKCDSKVNLSKKGTDYSGIGCPGDCDADTDGLQECASMAAFQASVLDADTGARAQLGLLQTGIDLACGLDTGENQASQARQDCVAENAAVLVKYAKGLFKCQYKCEKDYKAKKGNGGLDNGESCLSGTAGAADAFNTCDGDALSKAGTLTPNVASIVVPALRDALNDATVGLYDRSDPTGSPADNPCGTCGNNSREGTEVCDGTDDSACSGACASDCTCP